MSHEEKAKELVERFKPLVTIWDCYNDSPQDEKYIIEDAKKCALIAVNLAIEAIEDCSVVAGFPLDDYKNLKTEIEKLNT